MSWLKAKLVDGGAFVAAALVLGAAAYVRGYRDGSDVRQCATGPSPEEQTMRDFHDACRNAGGVYRWRFNHNDLALEAGCLGAYLEEQAGPSPH